MRKLILVPAIVMLAALSACSSGGDAPAGEGAETTEEVAEEAAAPATNADNDTAEPETDAQKDDDHPHGPDEGEHSH
jgi:sugar phosphate permease